jgi:hypothetical protein
MYWARMPGTRFIRSDPIRSDPIRSDPTRLAFVGEPFEEA